MPITFSHRFDTLMVAIMVVILMVFMYPVKSRAMEIQIVPADQTLDIKDQQKLNLVYGKPVFIKTSRDLTRISEPNPNVVLAELINPREIYLQPRAPGTTNLILWHNKEIQTIYQINVGFDLSGLKQRIYELFPDETELRIMSNQNSILLSGRVSSASILDQILLIAEDFVPPEIETEDTRNVEDSINIESETTTDEKQREIEWTTESSIKAESSGNIRNLVEVGGVHQVMLEVTVAEVSRESLKRMGVDFSLVHEGGEFALGFLGSRIGGSGAADGFFSLQTSRDRTLQWTSIFDMLQEEGLAEILAEPSLIALSGQTASFLAGGEFPVPILVGDGERTGVDWRSYGVELAFTPTVLNKDRIAINVVPVVSELDPGRGTDVFGSFVPATTVRRAETTVELGDGQSFAIAGLLSESSGEVISKFPGLGDLPILGSLFTSKRFQTEKTELVIMVTPRLVSPMVAEEQHLPTDFYIEPDDAEFYLWGVFGRSHEHMPTRGNATFDGEFGHVLVR